MSRILITAVSAVLLPFLLTGCAANDSYDKTVLPDASASMRQASVNCVTKWAVKEFTTYSELAACNLAAERKFFTAVKMQKMDKFEAYAAGYQALAADRDAHRISDSEAGRRAANMRRDFLAACHCTRDRMPGGEMSITSSPGYLGP